MTRITSIAALEALYQPAPVAASTTKAGKVTLAVALAHNDVEDDWRLTVPVFTEAGQLERIAREVASFFRENASVSTRTGDA